MSAAGLYVYHAESEAPGGAELDVPFLVTEKSGLKGNTELSTISLSGHPVQRGDGLKPVDVIRAAVEQAGGICACLSDQNWSGAVRRAYSEAGQWVVYTLRRQGGGARRQELAAVQPPAAAALGRFLERNPGHASLAQRNWGGAAGAGRAGRVVQQQENLAGFYVLPATSRAPSSGRVEVPLVCRPGEGGWQLDGITASGALLPAGGRSKMGTIRAAAEAWGCAWGAGRVWNRVIKQVRPVGGEWRFAGRGGAPGGSVQAAAVRAISSFVSQHPWAADLAQLAAQRREQQEAAAGAEGPHPGPADQLSPAEQPEAGPEGLAGSSESDGSHSAAQAPSGGGGADEREAARLTPQRGRPALFVCRVDRPGWGGGSIDVPLLGTGGAVFVLQPVRPDGTLDAGASSLIASIRAAVELWDARLRPALHQWDRAINQVLLTDGQWALQAMETVRGKRRLVAKAVDVAAARALNRLLERSPQHAALATAAGGGSASKRGRAASAAAGKTASRAVSGTPAAAGKAAGAAGGQVPRDWLGGEGGGRSLPASAAAQPSRDALAATPSTQQLKVEALFGPWSYEAEAQRLREGNQALAAENEALRGSIAKERQTDRALAESNARRRHLKARAGELKQELCSSTAKAKRMQEVLEE